MPGKVLTTGSQVQCPHGGSATLTTGNSKVGATSGKALLESDTHTVSGCSFMIGNKPSPCIKIEWSAGASKVKANGTAVLVKSSVGKCYSPENALQGTAIVAQADAKASAQ
jgi:hypothetical protein